jgi:uncharacterized membrane protein YccC
MKLGHLEGYVITTRNQLTPINAVRTAVAATATLLCARLLRLPEDYWAAISCIIVTQSSLGTALPISVQRFVGAAIGAVAGALAASLLGTGFLSFGFSVFAVGILCWAFRVEKSAYRYAGITVAIVMLANHAENAWTVAFHRFAEVSLGISVALFFATVWPERPSASIQK